jgi:hypothetical protein
MVKVIPFFSWYYPASATPDLPVKRERGFLWLWRLVGILRG